MPTSAAVYARISLDRDNEQLGVSRQRQDCLELAKRLGWGIGEVYLDNSISASKDVLRPEYERMIADLSSGKRDGLIVYDLDRLTRKPAELESFIALAEKAGFALANVAGDVDLSTANGRMLARFKGAIARQEAERIGERVSRAAKQRAEQGKPQKAKHRPFGYTVDYEIVPDEAEMIRQAYARVIAGESITSIMRDFQANFSTVAGGKWYRQTVKKILQRPANAGIREYKGEEVGVGDWTPIVDRATYDAAMETFSKASKPMPDMANKHLLSAICKCGLCGFPMYGRRRGKGSTAQYTCMPTHGGCGRIARAQEPLDKYIISLVVAHLEKIAPVVAVANENDDKIAETQKRISDLQKAYSDEQLSMIDFMPLVNAERQKLKQYQRKEAKAATVATKSTRAEHFIDANLSQQRAIIKRYIRDVVVMPTGRGSRKLDYDCIKVIKNERT
ncbi:recombinase family protein [Rhodococcus erythropolis]|uniref:recombinase family protein n=1 Tax=Rhodococcus erythropolis TaxID=1833 RepID=UPI001E3819F7|nr:MULTISPECIES: recombinase family protein [Rhodococcus erythropolis group]MCD2108710.1 recombinase family protein [Rhodococcus qingshengii]MCZ4527741.1 recombinase family protein [Rhodococcus erythropolis]